MVKEINNNHYINAPAGSGKTNFIETKINQILTNQNKCNILCITYTNRAANEMKERILNNDVEISTIHSFINKFLKPFFPLIELKDLYYDLFKNDIHKSFEKYKTDYYEQNDLPDEIVFNKEIYLSNLKKIYYNEKDYNNELNGGLSHDNLLLFAWNLLEKHPVLKTKIYEIYDYIFIDEVQDTSADILRFFYNSLKYTDVELFFLGDKMQEIFDNYDGSFEKEYSEMNTSFKKEFGINYRSSTEIVKVLNNLYLSDNYVHQISKKGPIGITPKIYIVNSYDDFLDDNDTEDYLTLRLNNRKLFENPDSNKNLSDVYNLFNKIYGYNANVSAKDILLPNEGKSEDNLVSFIYIIYYLKKHYIDGQIGRAIEIIKNSKYSQSAKKLIFNQDTFNISMNEHKADFSNKINFIIDCFSSDNNKSLKNFYQELKNNHILTKEYCEHISRKYLTSNPEIKDEHITVYRDIFELSVNKFVRLCEYNEVKNISTQHGVKGEGHDKVIFVAEKSTNEPRVDIDKFFKLISTHDEFNFDDFQKFYYEYLNNYRKVLDKLKLESHSHIKSEIFHSNKEYLLKQAEKYEHHEYFKIIKEDKYEYFEKPKSSAKRFENIFRITEIKGALQAYKLFYVGCSRAKDSLKIVVEDSLIDGFEKEFINKFESIGFEIIKKL